MLNEALNYVSTALGALIGWLDKLFSAIPGAVGLILSIFAMFTAIRLFIAPIVGGLFRAGISDTVKRVRSHPNSNSKSGG